MTIRHYMHDLGDDYTLCGLALAEVAVQVTDSVRRVTCQECNRACLSAGDHADHAEYDPEGPEDAPALDPPWWAYR